MLTSVCAPCRVTPVAPWWVKRAPPGSRLEWWALEDFVLCQTRQESTPVCPHTRAGSTATSPPTGQATSPSRAAGSVVMVEPMLPSKAPPSPSRCYCPSHLSSSLSSSSRRRSETDLLFVSTAASSFIVCYGIKYIQLLSMLRTWKMKHTHTWQWQIHWSSSLFTKIIKPRVAP